MRTMLERALLVAAMACAATSVAAQESPLLPPLPVPKLPGIGIRAFAGAWTASRGASRTAHEGLSVGELAVDLILVAGRDPFAKVQPELSVGITRLNGMYGNELSNTIRGYIDGAPVVRLAWRYWGAVDPEDRRFRAELTRARSGADSLDEDEARRRAGIRYRARVSRTTLTAYSGVVVGSYRLRDASLLPSVVPGTAAAARTIGYGAVAGVENLLTLGIFAEISFQPVRFRDVRDNSGRTESLVVGGGAIRVGVRHARSAGG